jgi:hypothetical protein
MKQGLGAVGKRLPEMGEDLSCYAAVQTDRARLAVSRLVTRLVASILQIIAVAAVLATAASLLIVGIAGGLASALEGNVWLANIITGAAALIVLCGAIAVSVGGQRRTRLRHLQRRYRGHEARDRRMAGSGGPETRNHAERR